MSVELESFSGSQVQSDAPAGDGVHAGDGAASGQSTLIAQATENEQAAPASDDPVPVDAGGETLVQPAAALAGTTLEYSADSNNAVRLPAGISIDNIRVSGPDLVIEQADGRLITIKNAASNVPSFMIGDVEVPRVALLAALEASGVEVAFGTDGSIAAGQGGALPDSSGGNFQIPPGSIGDAFDLSALLPPTALQFPQFGTRELAVGLRRREGDETRWNCPVRLPASSTRTSLPAAMPTATAKARWRPARWLAWCRSAPTSPARSASTRTRRGLPP
ncbi:hypothetical protein ACG873_00015 (plasmid) [Mesorhizobium sp. AaZ16]|uniref:hypothetical protein n=1 Tax=Mesorhizobium sp. AaZ16 TaxID=3402289 RepID=UPI00374E3B93